jgi:hypothetical protein
LRRHPYPLVAEALDELPDYRLVLMALTLGVDCDAEATPDLGSPGEKLTVAAAKSDAYLDLVQLTLRALAEERPETCTPRRPAQSILC